MKILFLGDIVGRIGRKTVTEHLPRIIRGNNIDFTIANGENATHGHGLSHSHYLHLLQAGIDVFTSGNHFLRNRDVFNPNYDFSRQLRPFNMHRSTPLVGTGVFDCGALKIRVTNLLGRSFMDNMVSNPFDCLQDIIAENETPIHIVDFHAEATGEKMSLARAFDGRVTAVFGTHTHVQTADQRILGGGTAYITDVGMCGAYDSILGDDPQAVIHRTWTGLPAQFTIPESGPTLFCGVILSLGEDLRVNSVERLYVIN